MTRRALFGLFCFLGIALMLVPAGMAADKIKIGGDGHRIPSGPGFGPERL